MLATASDEPIVLHLVVRAGVVMVTIAATEDVPTAGVHHWPRQADLQTSCRAGGHPRLRARGACQNICTFVQNPACD